MVGALGKPPLEARPLGRVVRRLIGAQLDPHEVHRRLGVLPDLVSLLGHDRHGLDLVQQAAGEVVDLGRGRLAAGEDAEVHPDLDRRLLVLGNHEGHGRLLV